MPITAIVFWIIYVTGVGAALVRPIFGVLLYIFVYHVNPDYQWWNVGPYAMHIRPSMVAAAVTLIGFALQGFRRNDAERRMPPSLVCLVLLVLYTVGSLYWGLGVSDRGMMQLEKIFKIAIFLWMMLQIVRTPETFGWFVLAWVAGLAYIGYQASGNVGVSISGRLTSGIGGPDFAESSTLAAHLTASLPLIGALLFCARSRLTQIVLLVIGALTVNTIIMTRTRNVLAGLAAMVFVAIFSLPKGYRFKGFVAVALGIGLSIQLADPGWWNRMASVENYSQDTSVVTRFAYWNASLRMSLDYPLGIGIGNFHEVVRNYLPALTMARSAHSTYHECLAELGYPGLLLLLCALIFAFFELRQTQEIAEERPTIESPGPFGKLFRFEIGWWVMAMYGALAAYLGCALFVTRFFSEDLWILVAMTSALRLAVTTATAEQPAGELLDPLSDLTVPALAPNTNIDDFQHEHVYERNNGVWAVN